MVKVGCNLCVFFIRVIWVVSFLASLGFLTCYFVGCCLIDICLKWLSIARYFWMYFYEIFL
jgi:hypothetical protein